MNCLVDWEGIVRRDGPAVWRTACRVLGNRADAEECVQDAFAAALEVARREPVRNWRALLQRLATARAVDRLRQRCRRGTRGAAEGSEVNVALEVADPGRGPSEAAEDRELLQRLRELLPTLPERQASALVLHAVEGWTYEQIGREFSVTPGAVGMLLLRARQSLQASLGHDVPRR